MAGNKDLNSFSIYFYFVFILLASFFFLNRGKVLQLNDLYLFFSFLLVFLPQRNKTTV